MSASFHMIGTIKTHFPVILRYLSKRITERNRSGKRCMPYLPSNPASPFTNKLGNSYTIKHHITLKAFTVEHSSRPFPFRPKITLRSFPIKVFIYMNTHMFGTNPFYLTRKTFAAKRFKCYRQFLLLTPKTVHLTSTLHVNSNTQYHRLALFYVYETHRTTATVTTTVTRFVKTVLSENNISAASGKLATKMIKSPNIPNMMDQNRCRFKLLMCVFNSCFSVSSVVFRITYHSH